MDNDETPKPMGQVIQIDEARIRDHRHADLSIQRGCELMGVSRSSFYAEPIGRPADAVIVAETRYDRCPKAFLSATAVAATVINWLRILSLDSRRHPG